jgi:hypothetical protein
LVPPRSPRINANPPRINQKNTHIIDHQKNIHIDDHQKKPTLSHISKPSANTATKRVFNIASAQSKSLKVSKTGLRIKAPESEFEQMRAQTEARLQNAFDKMLLEKAKNPPRKPHGKLSAASPLQTAKFSKAAPTLQPAKFSKAAPTLQPVQPDQNSTNEQILINLVSKMVNMFSDRLNQPPQESVKVEPSEDITNDLPSVRNIESESPVRSTVLANGELFEIPVDTVHKDLFTSDNITNNEHPKESLKVAPNNIPKLNTVAQKGTSPVIVIENPNRSVVEHPPQSNMQRKLILPETIVHSVQEGRRKQFQYMRFYMGHTHILPDDYEMKGSWDALEQYQQLT